MAKDEDGKYPSWKWIVLIAIMIIGFLATQGVNSISAKINDQENAIKSLAVANQAVCDRVTKLEANLTYIAQGIGRLEEQNKAMVTALKDHEKYSRKGRSE